MFSAFGTARMDIWSRGDSKMERQQEQLGVSGLTGGQPSALLGTMLAGTGSCSIPTRQEQAEVCQGTGENSAM